MSNSMMDLFKSRRKQVTEEAKMVEEYAKSNAYRVGEISKALEKIELNNVYLYADSIDIYVSGDKHVLQAIFHALRRIGYNPDNRPDKEPSPGFATFWRQENWPTLYLNFTSDKCTRVQTGTEVKEVPIYEIICE